MFLLSSSTLRHRSNVFRPSLASIISWIVAQPMSLRVSFMICMSSAHALKFWLLQFAWQCKDCAVSQHFNVPTFVLVLWMCFPDHVVKSLLSRISERHQRFYIVFGNEPLDTSNHTIRSFDFVTAPSVIFCLVGQLSSTTFVVNLER